MTAKQLAGTERRFRRPWRLGQNKLTAGVRVSQQQPDLPPELRPLAEMPLLKRLAARLFGHGLTRLRAQHRFSWLHGQADGFRSGHEAGVEYGYR